MDAGYPAVDPRIIRARQSSEPFIWNEALFSEVPELWADLQARGIQHGWSQSTLHEPGGIGMLSLCRSTPITEQDLQTRLQHMQWLALLAHKAFSKLIRARIASNAPSLTERELEVLRWTADGKSAQDIAEILLLSKNTVDFHIRNSITAGCSQQDRCGGARRAVGAFPVARPTARRVSLSTVLACTTHAHARMAPRGTCAHESRQWTGRILVVFFSSHF